MTRGTATLSQRAAERTSKFHRPTGGLRTLCVRKNHFSTADFSSVFAAAPLRLNRNKR
jgi:hypothetical protein